MNVERDRICTLLLRNPSMTETGRNKLISRFFDIQNEITDDEFHALRKATPLPEYIHSYDYRVNAAFKFEAFVRNDGLVQGLIAGMEKCVFNYANLYMKALLYIYLSLNGQQSMHILNIFSYNKRWTDSDVTNINNLILKYNWNEDTIVELSKRGVDMPTLYSTLKKLEDRYEGQVQFKADWVENTPSYTQTSSNVELPQLPTVYHIDRSLFSVERSWLSHD